jgi:translocation and assembly module TamB
VNHPLTFELGVALSGDKVRLTGEALYSGHRIGLDQPVAVDFGETLTLKAPRVSVADGWTALDATMAPDAIGIDMTLKDLDLALFNLMRPGLVQEGVANGRIRAGWRRGRTERLAASLSLSAISFRQAGLVSLEEPTRYAAELSARTQDNELVFTGSVSTGQELIGKLDAHLPYDFDPDDRRFRIRESAPLSASVNWQGDVRPLWRIAGRPDHILEGGIDGTLSVTGTLENPVFSGGLELADGRYEYLPLGLIASVEQLSISGDEDQIKLVALEATDGEGGRLSGSGAFDLSAELSFPGILTFSLTDFRAARLDVLQGTVSAGLSYERAASGARLEGQVTTGKMNVTLPKELPISVVELDVIEINGLADDNEAQGVLSRQQPTRLDVTIRVPERFFVEGRGLTSEWRGDLHLGGTTEDPRLTGEIGLKNGYLSFGSKKVDLEEGRLEFRGKKGLDPDVALSARYTARTIDATMTVSGTLSAPEWTLQSVPELPEDEILSRILIGRSASELSALQMAEIVAAANTLRGSGGTDVVGRLRRGLGLDTLSIGQDHEDDDQKTLISGGKYLRDNILLELETVPANSEAAARLEVELTDNIAVETEAGLKQGARLRLKWFWEY